MIEVSKICALMWKSMSVSDKEPFTKKYHELQEKHKREMMEFHEKKKETAGESDPNDNEGNGDSIEDEEDE